MDFKNYYAALGVERNATHDEVKKAYRKLARKYHPDVSKEPDAEARFKEVAEAHEVLIDPERRAAYDEQGQRREQGQPFEPGGFEFTGGGGEGEGDARFSEFFESLFGRGGGARRRQPSAARMPVQGEDHHAKVMIDLLDAYRGAQRSVTLRVPVVDAQGYATLQERRLDVDIPKGVREGQHLRLAGQGAAAADGAGPPGDLYLEIKFRPHPQFRLDGRDVYVGLPVSPWEAALGAQLPLPTPQGTVQLTVPPDSTQGRKLRLKGRGLPGKEPGDLYAVLTLALPPASSEDAKAAYRALALAFPGYDARMAARPPVEA